MSVCEFCECFIHLQRLFLDRAEYISRVYSRSRPSRDFAVFAPHSLSSVPLFTRS